MVAIVQLFSSFKKNVHANGYGLNKIDFDTGGPKSRNWPFLILGPILQEVFCQKISALSKILPSRKIVLIRHKNKKNWPMK